MFSRRNFLIRSIATLAGDFSVGFTVGLACTWVIQSAALGLFLSFLAWLLAIILALAVSQHLVHPAANLLLCDRKLDRGIDATLVAARSAVQTMQHLWLRIQPAST